MMTLLTIFHTYYVFHIYIAFQTVHRNFINLCIIISLYHITATPSLYQSLTTTHRGMILVNTTLANDKICDAISTIHTFIYINHIPIL